MTLVSSADSDLIPPGTVFTQFPDRDLEYINPAGGYWDVSHVDGSTNSYKPNGIWGFQPVLIPETSRTEIHDNGNIGEFKWQVLRCYDERDTWSESSTFDSSLYDEAVLWRVPLTVGMQISVFGQLASGDVTSDNYNNGDMTYESMKDLDGNFPGLTYADEGLQDLVLNAGLASSPLYLHAEGASFANRIWEYGSYEEHMLQYFDDGGMMTYWDNNDSAWSFPGFSDIADWSPVMASPNVYFDMVRGFHPDETTNYKTINNTGIPSGSGSKKPIAILNMGDTPGGSSRKKKGFIQLSYQEDDWGIRFPNWVISFDPDYSIIKTEVGSNNWAMSEGVSYNPFGQYALDRDLMDGAASSCGIPPAPSEFGGFEFYQKFEDVNGYSGFAIGKITMGYPIQILTRNISGFGSRISTELDNQTGLYNLIKKENPLWNLTKVWIPK